MKIKIAIVNTLKPVDDVRGFEKIGQSIAKANKYQVNIIGNIGKKNSGNPDIQFVPHSISSRDFIRRFIIRIITLVKLFKLNPKVIIVQTHELLIISLLHSIFNRSKIIYDVQEDYKKNILYLSQIPQPFRAALAYWVRLKERLAIPFISQFWLAEKCYSYEIGFPKRKTKVLENKATTETLKHQKTNAFNCLFSGTISSYGGVLLAIELFKKMTQKKSNVRLVIIGQCHDSKLQQVLTLEKEHSNIELIIDRDPIDHKKIIEHIFKSDIGIVAYQPNEVNKNKLPTKVFEYSQYQLPYVIQKGTTWANEGKVLGGAIPVDFNNPDIDFILNQVENKDSLFNQPKNNDQSWESQEVELMHSLNSLL